MHRVDAGRPFRLCFVLKEGALFLKQLTIMTNRLFWNKRPGLLYSWTHLAYPGFYINPVNPGTPYLFLDRVTVQI
jgi:hypothetical protein